MDYKNLYLRYKKLYLREKYGGKSKINKIIITLPHVICNDQIPIRNCELNSKLYGETLKKTLGDVFEVKIIESKQNRFEIDLN